MDDHELIPAPNFFDELSQGGAEALIGA